MKRTPLIVGGIIAVILILILWGVSSYNSFTQLDENVKGQLGNLNNVYQQRVDLIPNLVSTVQASAVNERQTLTDVITARSKATGVQLTPEALKDPQAFQNFQKVQGDLSSALSHLMVVSEKYPELRSQENFTVLMSQLEGQENRIRVERNRYNDLVNTYNARIRRFPSNIMAGITGFTQYPYFQAAQGSENAPRVDFGTGNPAPSNGSQVPPPPPAAPPAPQTAPHGAVRPAPVH